MIRMNDETDVIEWDGGTKLHTVSYQRGPHEGVCLCFNQTLSDGGHLCLTLPIKDRVELKVLIEFLERQFDVAERIAENLRTGNLDRYM